MSRERAKRSTRPDDDRLAIRFQELAVLQKALLAQQAEIDDLRVQNRKASFAPAPSASETGGNDELTAAQGRIAELERVQAGLVEAVYEKERQRFALAVELQDALVRLEEAHLGAVADGPILDAVKPDDLFLAQEALLREREKKIAELESALDRAQEDQGAPDSIDELAKLGEIVRTQENLLREREDVIAELTAASRVPNDPETPKVSDDLLRAVMLEYHAMTTSALAERDHAVMTIALDASAGIQRVEAAR
ncbi:hypothetical protein [Paracoccus aestuariivivens]|uniref:Uncharacterized protein n=1 Tax=Paracoccus aestuariivivens TaxID=1820333 RepID=A0A6L6JDW2_9RHOB|nr:hypothetical protein [Paracoccus aestuariivivens]MTH78354.1 hypothetical protein [Paracoccus aestuariivivens]